MQEHPAPPKSVSAEKFVASARTLASELTANELASLKQTLQSLKTSGVAGEHIEIGTAAGGTLVQMLDVFGPGQSPPFWVVDVMTYFTDQLGTVHRNLREHGHDPAKVRFFVMLSRQALRQIAANPPKAAFLFIDADHEIRGVTFDLQWAQFLQPGGVVCLHDYWPSSQPGSKWNGVTLAADRFLKKNPNYERVSLTDSLLILRKTRASERREVSFYDLRRAEVLRNVLKLRNSAIKRWRTLKGLFGQSAAA